jgi:hypothetical protein
VNSATVICSSKIHKKSAAHEQPILCEPSLQLCGQCLHRTSRNLNEMPAVYQELGQDLLLRAKDQTFPRTSRSAYRCGFLANDALIDIRKAITDTLVSWSNLVADERQLSACAHALIRVERLSFFLLSHLRWLAAHPAASDFVQEVDDIYSEAVSSLKSPAISSLGDHICQASGCNGRLRTVLNASGTQMQIELRCEAGHSWRAEQWLSLREESGPAGQPQSSEHAPRRVPTKVAAVAIGVSEATIRQWVRRGKLTRYGTGSRAEYDLDELAALSRRAARESGA